MNPFSLARAAALTALAVPTGLLVRAGWGLPTAMGAGDRTLRRAAQDSPNFRDGSFVNTEPSSMLDAGATPSLLRDFVAHRGRGRPDRPVPLVTPAPAAVPADLAVTWFGHASALVEVDGARVLVDPVWGERCSPSTMVGPKRIHPAPGSVEDLPQVDAVLISHDHYDHLDLPTVRGLLTNQTAPFLVPVGVGEHLRGWGVPADRVVELDWEDGLDVAGLRITCTEARHFSGRGLTRNTTLWSSWVIAGPRHRVYFGGDTGYTRAFARIGAQHGPFDLTLLPIGAYGVQWPDIHMNPEEAVRAHGDLGGELLLPIHWATFDLATHDWAEPPTRLLAAAAQVGAQALVPRPGERIDVSARTTGQGEPLDWWSELVVE